MTAEVAILNKSAVALAADSAVTISAGSAQQKIFDSADKLFELTNGNAIAVMINSSMNFMEAPLPVLIKDFRERAPVFARVSDAANAFLIHLNEFGGKSPDSLKLESIRTTVSPIFELIDSRAKSKFFERIFKPEGGFREEYEKPEAIAALNLELHDIEIAALERVYARLPDAKFVGNGVLRVPAAVTTAIRGWADELLSVATPQQKTKAVQVAKLALKKAGVGSTGLIVAGFGKDDLFPTLLSFQLHGMVAGRLKYSKAAEVDIDRQGVRAAVLPFAQREMVERFLYGLDTGIEREIAKVCRETVPQISAEIIASLELENDGLKALRRQARRSERAFYDGLRDKAFEAIREKSRAEIEDMVEFMPKPELARMAEALVNLTSIKRRVSRGFETVGGPIDVAVISKAEGFVWVKRKHYFDPSLNIRYVARTRIDHDQPQGGSDAHA